MAALSFVEHYLAYLSSPAVLLAILVVVGPIFLEVFMNRALARGPTKNGVPGCFRLGLSKPSNLPNHYAGEGVKENDQAQDATAHIASLFTYPVKSCRGIELAASEVGPTGLKYDRLFTFAQLISKPEKTTPTEGSSVDEVSKDWKHQWRFITQREVPRLALLETELWVPDPRKTKNGQAKKGQANSRVKDNGGTAVRSRGSKGTRDVSSPQQSPRTQSTETPDLESDWAANGGCLIIRFPHEPDFNPLGLRTDVITLRIPILPTSQRAAGKGYTSESLSIWRDCPTAINISNEIASEDLAKLRYFLGISNPLALFRVDDRNQRAVTRNLPADRPDETYTVGFGDAFPIHLLNLASVRAIDDDLPKKSKLKARLDARRFRSNIYLTGPSAYTEDTWKRITIGRGLVPHPKAFNKMVEAEGLYHVACRTARCTLPNTSQYTGIKDATNEPYSTLSKTRKVDKGAYPHPCLGMQMIPLFQQGILRVGDEVGVLETGEHVYEKMFG